MSPGHVLLVIAVALLVSSQSIADDFSCRDNVECSALMPREDVIQQVQDIGTAMRSGSCLTLAEFVRFPFVINYPKQPSRSLWNRTAFCRYYSAIFDDSRTNAFLEGRLDDTPVGYRGLHFRRSGVWLQPVCPGVSPQADCPHSELRLKLVSVNL